MGLIGATYRMESDVIRSIVDAIVRHVNPLSVILFGSRARGDTHQHSDIDLMVIVPEGIDVDATYYTISDVTRSIYPALDILVCTSDTFAERGRLLGTVQRAALLDGVELHGTIRHKSIKAGIHDMVDISFGATYMRNAEYDMRTASENTSAEPHQVVARAQHSQQAAEKALKAALVWSEMEPVHTHCLDILYERLPSDWNLVLSISDLKKLTEMLQQSRYGAIPPTKDDADWAYGVASGILATIRRGASQRGLC